MPVFPRAFLAQKYPLVTFGLPHPVRQADNLPDQEMPSVLLSRAELHPDLKDLYHISIVSLKQGLAPILLFAAFPRKVQASLIPALGHRACSQGVQPQPLCGLHPKIQAPFSLLFQACAKPP